MRWPRSIGHAQEQAQEHTNPGLQRGAFWLLSDIETLCAETDDRRATLSPALAANAAAVESALHSEAPVNPRRPRAVRTHSVTSVHVSDEGKRVSTKFEGREFFLCFLATTALGAEGLQGPGQARMLPNERCTFPGSQVVSVVPAAWF